MAGGPSADGAESHPSANTLRQGGPSESSSTPVRRPGHAIGRRLWKRRNGHGSDSLRPAAAPYRAASAVSLIVSFGVIVLGATVVHLLFNVLVRRNRSCVSRSSGCGFSGCWLGERFRVDRLSGFLTDGVQKFVR